MSWTSKWHKISSIDLVTGARENWRRFSEQRAAASTRRPSPPDWVPCKISTRFGPCNDQMVSTCYFDLFNHQLIQYFDQRFPFNLSIRFIHSVIHAALNEFGKSFLQILISNKNPDQVSDYGALFSPKFFRSSFRLRTNF